MKKYRFAILLFAFYSLLSLVITYPLVLKFSSTVYSIPERLIDGLVTIYDLWWNKQVFLHGGSPDFIPNLGLSGVQLQRPLPYHMLIVYKLAKWLTILVNEVFAFNLLILLSFPLAGMAMYLLAFEVTKNKWAAALAGFIYAFSPLHRRYSFEWLGNAQWHWLPLYVLSLLKLDETKSIKWGLLTGLLFSITFIENYYFGYFAVFFTLAFVLLRFPLDRQRLKSYLLALLTILILTLPITSTFVRESHRLATGEEAEIPGFTHEEWPRFAFSARPWFYLLPDINHPIFGQYVEKAYAWIARHPPFFITKPFHPREHSLYLGWTILTLSAVAVFAALRKRLSTHPVIPSEAEESSEAYSAAFGLDPSTPPRLPLGVAQDDKRGGFIWLFLLLGVVMAIFSAPPYVTINLRKIYFPSHFLSKIFPMFRSYARCGVLVLLCVSVLAACGIKLILEKWKSPRSKVIFLTLTFGLIFFEFLDFPRFRNENIGVDPAHQWLAEQPGDFAIAEYLVFNNRPLIQQRYHQKRLINPLRWAPSEVEAAMKVVHTRETVAKLSEWGVKYLVLHTRTPEYLASIPGYTLVASFPESIFYILEVTGLANEKTPL